MRGALAPFGPQPCFVYASRLASEGKLDSTAFLDFVCRELAGVSGGLAALDGVPAPQRRRQEG